ncbi:MAG: accessory factor UbiK family protein [Pseudomonadota bacterium]|nr:accessory factor UbiK family protein [Pseudomonadota bacterium]
MQTSHKLFDDMAKVASGAMDAMSGVRHEIETMIRHQTERIMGRMNVVPREDFDAVKAMAAKAREEQDVLVKRVAHLESRVMDLLRERSTRLAAGTEQDGTSPPVET